MTSLASMLASKTPHFPKASVVFVLGGPGSGKGTQCEMLVKEFGYTHLSAGELLRDEQKSGSVHGELINTVMKNGTIVPGEITIGLLKNAMGKNIDSKCFLIDGFPRRLDQAQAFEAYVAPCKFVLFLDVKEHNLMDRLLLRGKTSGRVDDNVDSIMKRFRTHQNESLPVIDYYRSSRSRVRQVDASGSVGDVYSSVRKAFHDV